MKFTQKLQQCSGGLGQREWLSFIRCNTSVWRRTGKKKTEAIKEEAKESRHFQKEDVPKHLGSFRGAAGRADTPTGAQPSSRTTVKTTSGEQEKWKGENCSIEWAADKIKCGSERKRQERGLGWLLHSV